MTIGVGRYSTQVIKVSPTVLTVKVSLILASKVLRC